MTVEAIKRFTILEGLTPEESDTILQRCQITPVRKGEKVFEAGGPANCLFLVRSGKIELRFKVVYFNGSVEVPLEKMGAGAVIGWSALIAPHRYTLTGYATEDSELLQISRTEFEACCEANPRAGYLVMRNIARIIGERYEFVRQILAGEIQSDLKKKEDHTLWKTD